MTDEKENLYKKESGMLKSTAKRISTLLDCKTYFIEDGMLWCYDCGEGPTRVAEDVKDMEPGSVVHESAIIIDEAEAYLKRLKEGGD